MRTSLPSGVEPTVFTGSLDDFPVVQLSISGGEGTSDADLATLVQDTVVPRFEQIDDVREVTVTGVADDAVTITLDMPALAGVGLSPAAWPRSCRTTASSSPPGRSTRATPPSRCRWAASCPRSRTSRPCRWSAPRPRRRSATSRTSRSRPCRPPRTPASTASRRSASPSPRRPRATRSRSRTARRTRSRSPRTSWATTVQVAVVFDQAPFIEESIEGLTTEGVLGLLFAVLVILVFLMSVRSTLVTAISIPLSLLVTFIGAVGRRLLAEHPHARRAHHRDRPGGRRLDRGAGEHQAAPVLRRGPRRPRSSPRSARSRGAITASTLTTVAVFLPIALVGGMVGELFRPFAITVTVALLASLLVSLTIVPVLAYWFLRPPREGAGRRRRRVDARGGRGEGAPRPPAARLRAG